MSSNRTIAKNTLFLYFRMFFNMGVSLYVSRIILQVLGIEDFGIYNLVGGVVVLFAFLNNAMTAATQRFLNIEIASKIITRVREVFSMSLNVHALIAVIILLLSETIGLWFLNTKLNIPVERMFAANIVYQFSIVTTLVEVLKVPYNAIILAHERMSFYAVTSIIETIVRFLFVLSLYSFPDHDKLILYGALTLLLNLLSTAVFYWYCSSQFREEVKYLFQRDKRLFWSLLSFSGWSLFGQTAVLSATQGVNITLNIFIGVTVNAAMGIAGQVNNAVYGFVSNAQVAFNPQIIQSYAEGNYSRHINLVLQASRYSFFLFMIVCTPFILATGYILQLWLGDAVPPYTVAFTKIVILTSVVTSLAGPLWMSAYAVGNIKRYQIILSSVTIITLPLAYILLKLGYSPVFVLIGKLAVDISLMIFRIIYFKITLNVNNGIIFNYLKGSIPLLLLFFVMAAVYSSLEVSDFAEFILYCGVAEIIVLALVVLLGVQCAELRMFINLFKRKLYGDGG